MQMRKSLSLLSQILTSSFSENTTGGAVEEEVPQYDAPIKQIEETEPKKEADNMQEEVGDDDEFGQDDAALDVKAKSFIVEDFEMTYFKEEVGCQHEIVMPKGHTRKREIFSEVYSNLILAKYTGKAAKEYPFKLDPFQQTAVNCLEMGESVLVVIDFFFILP